MTTTITLDSRTVALDLINRYLPVFATGMSIADDLTVQHEAERLDSVPDSPVIRSMRQIVDAEQGIRARRDRLPVGSAAAG